MTANCKSFRERNSWRSDTGDKRNEALHRDIFLLRLREPQTAETMNYIFGNNTLYPRSARVGGGQGAGHGVKHKLGPKRASSEEIPPTHTSSPSTSSPASSSPSTSSSRWQQLLTFFSKRSAFTDCIAAGQVTCTSHPLSVRVLCA